MPPLPMTWPSRSSSPTSPTRSRRARFRAADLVVETKPDLTPVSEADTAVERALRDRLGAARPDDAIVGEEYGVSEGSGGGRRWIVDPIDGTKNYVRGIPVWATLLALQEGDQIAVGVVSAPALGRRWWAARGVGAFAADELTEEPRRLRVSAVRALEDAQLCMSGFDGWEDNGRLEQLLTLAGGAGAPAGSATSGPTCWSPRAWPRSAARRSCRCGIWRRRR